MNKARAIRGSGNYKSGLFAESLARLYFAMKGYRVLAARYRTPVGEIDLIVKRGKSIAFVEIKRRQSLDAAAESIQPRQQQRITRAAQHFLKSQPRLEGCLLRFDVLLLSPANWPRHIENAWMECS